MEIKGTRALVTGGARRVGRVIAVELARAGADIVVHYLHSVADARATAQEIRELGRDCELVRADLADATDVEALLQRMKDDGGSETMKDEGGRMKEARPVDILVNCAAVFPRTPLGETTAAQWDAVMAVNLRAPFLLARTLGMAMKARGGGVIVNIGDAGTARPYADHLPYLVSKAALEAMTRVLALELAPQVRVNTVSPGTVLWNDAHPPEWEAAARRRTLLGRLGTPEEVAAMVVHLVRHGDFCTGGNYTIDGGAGVG
jgi:pteridine reductase